MFFSCQITNALIGWKSVSRNMQQSLSLSLETDTLSLLAICYWLAQGQCCCHAWYQGVRANMLAPVNMYNKYPLQRGNEDLVRGVLSIIEILQSYLFFCFFLLLDDGAIKTKLLTLFVQLGNGRTLASNSSNS